MGTFQNEFPHMAYIKDAGIPANCSMLIIDAGIGNGHIVTGEFRHFRTKGNMFIGKGRIFHTSKIVRKCRAKSPDLFAIKKSRQWQDLFIQVGGWSINSNTSICTNSNSHSHHNSSTSSNKVRHHGWQ